MKIDVYTKEACIKCVELKQWLNENNFIFNEISLNIESNRETFLSTWGPKLKTKTVPQVIVNEANLLGGCDDVKALGIDKFKEIVNAAN